MSMILEPDSGRRRVVASRIGHEARTSPDLVPLVPLSTGDPLVTVTVKNPGLAPIYATEDGVSFEILPGGSIETDARTAMILGEYGAIVDRDAVDTALLAAEGRLDVDHVGSRDVETVFSPFAEHGPGVSPTGVVFDADAQARYSEAVQGDTSKTPGQVAALTSTEVAGVMPAAGVTVSSAGGVTDADGESVKSSSKRKS